MSGGVSQHGAFREWLSREECFPWLMTQARILLRKAGDLGLPSEIWPYPRPEEMTANQWRDGVDALANEFWLFLVEKFSGETGSLPAELAFAPKHSANLMAAYLRGAFLNHLRGRARSKSVSLYRYLYRRLREDIQGCPGFQVRLSGGWKLYSLESAAEPLGGLAGHIPASYGSWSSPQNIVSEKQFLKFKKTDLCALARFFWEQTAERLGQPCFVPLSQLTAFLAAHYDCLRADNEPLSLDEAALQGQNSPAVQTQAQGLEMLARQLVSGWPIVRRVVFSLSLDPGDLTLKEIACATGLSGPSHVKYHLDAACQDLAEFCEAWPGVAPPPSERTFWAEFLLCTASICKKTIGGRRDGCKQSSNPLNEGIS